MESPGEVLTAQQAAELLQVSVRTALQLTPDGQLQGHKVGRVWRFWREDVLAYVRGEQTVEHG